MKYITMTFKSKFKMNRRQFTKQTIIATAMASVASVPGISGENTSSLQEN
jgi:hypothetical protein